MNENQKIKFAKSGFIKIESPTDFKKFIKKINPDIKSLLPDYEKNKLPKFRHRINGAALSQRLNNCLEMPMELKHPNILHGKRVTINLYDFPDSILPIVEHPHVLNIAQQALGTKNIVVHNGSLAASYPGNTGNDRQIHSDTRNFCDPIKSMQCLENNQFIVNIMILLEDADMNLAPMKVLTGTHEQGLYKKINSIVSRRLNLPEDQDNTNQPNWIYQELLPDFKYKEFFFKGNMGDISVLNSFTLHGATQNKTHNKVRRVAILNYGRYSDNCFHRNYPIGPSRIFVNKIINKNLVNLSFKKSASFSHHTNLRIVHTLDKIKSYFKKQIRRIKNPEIILAKLNLRLDKVIFLFNTKKREYANIGSGPVWSHHQFLNIDINIDNNPKRGKIKADFVNDLPLPIEENSIKGIYTSHCLEHLKDFEVKKVLKDAYRVLTPGGTLRIVLPDMEKMFDAYEKKDASFFDSFKVESKRHQIWNLDSWLRLVTRSFAGHVVDDYSDNKLYNMYAELAREEFTKKILNAGDKVIGPKSHPNTHKSYWFASKMIQLLYDLRFESINEMKKGHSRLKIFKNRALFDGTQPDSSFFIEATKPST